MDITLVINPGSASKKYALFRGGRQIFAALFEHISDGYGTCVEIDGTRQRCEESTENAFASSLEEMLALAKREKVIVDAAEITRVGVRIVAPGTFFQSHRIIDELYIRNLEKMLDAAPLHIPATLHELSMLTTILPGARCIGVSDSAFHSSIPEHARRYSVSRADREAYDMYRFGYHGLSVASVLAQAESLLSISSERVVVCHVGSGVSVTAVQAGKSIDTTMGFSPTSGLMMSSRAGDLDPGALIYLMKKKQLTPEDAEKYVATQGGFVGMVGQSDLRIALDRSAKGDYEARVAVEAFVYHIRKAIGGYAAVLGGIDTLILTATAAERNPLVRARICSGLEGLGIVLSEKENEACGGRSGILSHEKSTTKIVVVHTDEMGEIARSADRV